MRAAVMFLAAATLAILPISVQAQTAAKDEAASPKMKGPPNANGRTDDKSMTAPMPHDETTSASHLSGPPNANGFSKQ